jgi:hypothetical protein
MRTNTATEAPITIVVLLELDEAAGGAKQIIMRLQRIHKESLVRLSIGVLKAHDDYS